MKYRVTDKQIDDDGTVCYAISDGTNTIGTVFNDGIRTWKCVEAGTGLLINDASVRRRMYAAVRTFDASTTFPGTVPNRRRV